MKLPIVTNNLILPAMHWQLLFNDSYHFIGYQQQQQCTSLVLHYSLKYLLHFKKEIVAKNEGHCACMAPKSKKCRDPGYKLRK